MTLLAAKSNLRLPVVDETALVFKTGSPAITATLDANALTAARVFAVPDASTTLAGLSVAQTFTAVQRFDSSVGIGVTPTRVKFEEITDDNIAAIFQKTGSSGFSISTFWPSLAFNAYHNGTFWEALSNNYCGLWGINFSNGDMTWALTPTKPASGANIDTSFNTSLVVLKNDGKFGIGQTVPTTQLHVKRSVIGFTTSIIDVIVAESANTGTPGVGYGSALRFDIQSSTTADQQAARVAALWNVATHASRAADLVAYASDFGGEREIWRGRATGTAAAIGFLGATPIVRQTVAADATDLASAIALVNDIKAKLSAAAGGFGLFT